MRSVDAPQFGGDEVERAGPGDRDKFVEASPMIGTGTAVQPTASNHRPGDPRRVRH